MIEILEASHGGSTTLPTQLSDYESLDQLIHDVSTSTGITPENVLLFLEDGGELKDEILLAMYERGGQGGQSEPPVQELFLFNRSTFYAESPETWAVLYEEGLTLPPLLNLSAISDLAQAQRPFELASDHLQHLHSLFSAQARALSIAYSNLQSHLDPLLVEFQEFQARAKVHLDNEDRLLRSSKADMIMLPKVVIHEAFSRQKKDRRDSVEVAGEIKTMATFVNPVKMQQVREGCIQAHALHVKQFDRLASQMKDLALQSEAERRASEDRSQQVAVEFEQGIQRFELAISQLEMLFQNDIPTLSQDLMELDSAMRDDLSILTSVKNDYTLDLHIHLRQVADFQMRIAELVVPIHSLESEMTTQQSFPHLHRLHLLPFAYAATVTEIVRRKEFSSALRAWADRLSATFTTFANNEGARRREMSEITSQLPFVVTALEGTSPKFDLSVNTGNDALASFNIARSDVDDILVWIQNLRNDQELQAAILDEESDPVPFLEHGMDDLIGKMEEATSELDQMIERSVLLHKSKHGGDTPDFQSRLGVLNEENAVLRQEHNDHQSRFRQMEETHEKRTHSLQTRQAELQEELMRLRTDLEEEMLARQALSTELGEKTVEQERHHVDQTEIIAGLQMELIQEKDRATDLGTRLQDALLDVDGMRSAEVSLQAQLQTMQDERSRLHQSLSDAQNGSRQFESQLAGMKAELEATTQQLSQARIERDAALKNQSAEAERLMRDHIAEADGDRAVLEHQNLTLSKQVEDVRIEMEEKITAAKNMAVRTADGLKAELSFTKAQLRDVQRRETVLEDELAMAKDTAQAMIQKDAHQADVARDAVALVTKYHDTCQRIVSTITASATISASTHIIRPKSPTPLPTDKLQDSMLSTLATASTFDLDNFGDAVNKTISLVKKLNKSCRHYRDIARNKISFTAFGKGDLALFLPTRNATTRPWMAYNVSAPHHFLQVPGDKVEVWKARDSIIARILGTEEAVAGDTPESNPFGLAEGLRFYIHQVEEYSPSATIRTPRRSGSTVPPLESMTNISDLTPGRPLASTSRTSGFSMGSPEERKEYFPQTSRISLTQTPQAMSPEVGLVTSPVVEQIKSTPIAPKIDLPTQPTQANINIIDNIAASPSTEITPKLSPVFETIASSESATPLPPAPFPTARPAPPFAFRPPSSNLPLPTAPRPSGRTSHKRDNALIAPTFTPASYGRPPSITSSGGSYTQPSILSNVSKSALAPAMAVTTSSECRRSESRASNNSSGGSGIQVDTVRRPSIDSNRRYIPPLIGSSGAAAAVTRVPSSGALFSFDDIGLRSSPENPSPLSREASRRPSGGTASGSRVIMRGMTGGMSVPGGKKNGGEVGGISAAGTSPASPSDTGGVGSRLWTLGRKRLGSMVTRTEDDKSKSKPTTPAENLLKKFDNT